MAVGRRPDLAALGAASIGLEEHAPAIPTDDHLRVNGAERTWALGDVTGKGAFTHMSMYEADIVVNDILGNEVVPADYRAVPRVTFTDPEIGSVGLTEASARDEGITVRTGTASVPSSARGWIHKAGNEGLIKVVEDADRGVLVGATSMGPVGGEVLELPRTRGRGRRADANDAAHPLRVPDVPPRHRDGDQGPRGLSLSSRGAPT